MYMKVAFTIASLAQQTLMIALECRALMEARVLMTSTASDADALLDLLENSVKQVCGYGSFRAQFLHNLSLPQ